MTLGTPPSAPHSLYSSALGAALPEVRRARGYYLYCKDGRRIFDMYLANGRLAYGHKPFEIGTRMKEAIDCGLLSDLPHRHHSQLLQMCQRVFHPYCHFYLLPSIAAAIRFARRQPHHLLRVKRIFDPAYDTDTQSALAHKNAPTRKNARTRKSPPPLIAYHRPRLPIPHATILLPLLPLPHAPSTQLVCSRVPLRPASPSPASPSSTSPLPHTNAFDTIAMLHILREMADGGAGHHYSAKRADIVDPLRYRRQPLPSHWIAAGPYLHSTLGTRAYRTLFNTLLARDILINPAPIGLTLLPSLMPKKEYLKFASIHDIIEARRQS